MVQRYHSNMTLRVERIGDRLGVLLTPEQIEELSLREGSPVMVSAPKEPVSHRHATPEEVLEAFRSTQPQYDEVYRALAK